MPYSGCDRIIMPDAFVPAVCSSQEFTRYDSPIVSSKKPNSLRMGANCSHSTEIYITGYPVMRPVIRKSRYIRRPSSVGYSNHRNNLNWGVIVVDVVPLTRGKAGKQPVCNRYKKRGHLAKAFRPAPTFETNAAVINQVTGSETPESVLHANAPTSRVKPPYHVEIQVNNALMTYGPKTSGEVAVCNEKSWQDNLVPTDKSKPRQAPVRLPNHAREDVKLLGTKNVNALDEDVTANETIRIAEGKGPNLLGRDWLQQLPILILNQISTLPEVQSLIRNYKEIFSEQKTNKFSVGKEDKVLVTVFPTHADLAVTKSTSDYAHSNQWKAGKNHGPITCFLSVCGFVQFQDSSLTKMSKRRALTLSHSLVRNIAVVFPSSNRRRHKESQCRTRKASQRRRRTRRSQSRRSQLEPRFNAMLATFDNQVDAHRKALHIIRRTLWLYGTEAPVSTLVLLSLMIVMMMIFISLHLV
ncbi:hypothetical protein CLF_109993 [Clonorchis sinensis]|uniref:Uncharacterized protein n=1 Tax=Clonorchis sinensis TaxID=79923 RepID=G7YK38_CLOSI|nr:hypothetical protein CLF_109993 [Clonorchis sinensis]